MKHGLSVLAGAILVVFTLACSGFIPEPPPEGPSVIDLGPEASAAEAGNALLKTCRALLVAGDDRALDCMHPTGHFAFSEKENGVENATESSGEELRMIWASLNMLGLAADEDWAVLLPESLVFDDAGEGTARAVADLDIEGARMHLELEVGQDEQGGWRFTDVKWTIEQ